MAVEVLTLTWRRRWPTFRALIVSFLAVAASLTSRLLNSSLSIAVRMSWETCEKLAPVTFTKFRTASQYLYSLQWSQRSAIPRIFSRVKFLSITTIQAHDVSQRIFVRLAGYGIRMVRFICSQVLLYLSLKNAPACSQILLRSIWVSNKEATPLQNIGEFCSSCRVDHSRHERASAASALGVNDGPRTMLSWIGPDVVESGR